MFHILCINYHNTTCIYCDGSIAVQCDWHLARLPCLCHCSQEFKNSNGVIFISCAIKIILLILDAWGWGKDITKRKTWHNNKITVFWDITPCSLHMNIEVAGSSETCVASPSYQTARRNISENSNINIHLPDNIKFHDATNQYVL
jgi:hypothetical protein